MKTCNSCRKDKDEEEYHLNRAAKDGRDNKCKECKSESSRKKYANDPEYRAKKNIQHVQYNLDNKEPLKEKRKAKYWEDPDRFRVEARERSRSPEARARMAIAQKKYYVENREKVIEQAKKWARDNKDRVNARAMAWRRANPERSRSVQSEWKAKNKGRVSLLAKRWRDKNQAKVRDKSVRQRTKRAEATPAWANRDLVLRIYDEAKKLTNETGIEFHVDHIVPLNGKLVCGLHNEFNLQIITKKENLLKGNRFDI